MKDIRTDKNDRPSLLIPQTDCAIWDLTLWKTSNGVNPIIAEDSGKVTMIDPRNNAHTITLTVRIIVKH